MFKFFAQRFAHQAEKNPLQDDGLSKITLSGANRWHVSTHQQQKSLSVPKSQAADAQTPLTGTAAPSSAPEPLQGSAPVATAAIAQHFFFFLKYKLKVCPPILNNFVLVDCSFIYRHFLFLLLHLVA